MQKEEKKERGEEGVKKKARKEPEFILQFKTLKMKMYSICLSKYSTHEKPKTPFVKAEGLEREGCEFRAKAAAARTVRTGHWCPGGSPHSGGTRHVVLLA